MAGFRGPERNAVVPGLALAEDWSALPPRELWRISVGPGWSSFAVAGRSLFTQEQRGESEVVVAYDTQTGAELWVHEYRSRFFEAMGGVGPRATPTLSRTRVYSSDELQKSLVSSERGVKCAAGYQRTANRSLLEKGDCPLNSIDH